MLPALGILALALILHGVACDWCVDPEYLWAFRRGGPLPGNVIYSSSVLMITAAPSLTRLQGELLGMCLPALLVLLAFFFLGYDRGWKRAIGRAGSSSKGET
jgi:hypothetical protein